MNNYPRRGFSILSCPAGKRFQYSHHALGGRKVPNILQPREDDHIRAESRCFSLLYGEINIVGEHAASWTVVLGSE